MIEEKLVLTNDEGLHARPAGIFAKKAMEFSSEVSIEAKGEVVDAKSIMSMMGLGLDKGDEFTLKIEGDDEGEAAEALKKLLEEGFSTE